MSIALLSAEPRVLLYRGWVCGELTADFCMPTLHCEHDRMCVWCCLLQRAHGLWSRCCPTSLPYRSAQGERGKPCDILSSFSRAQAELLVQALQLKCEKAVLRGRTDASGVKSWARAVELSTSTQLIPQAQHIQSLNVKLIFSLSIFFFFYKHRMNKKRTLRTNPVKLFLAGWEEKETERTITTLFLFCNIWSVVRYGRGEEAMQTQIIQGWICCVGGWDFGRAGQDQDEAMWAQWLGMKEDKSFQAHL